MKFSFCKENFGEGYLNFSKNMLCLLFEDHLEIPFEKKESFIDFIIRSYIYGKTLEETEKFIRGFHNIIKPELLRGLSPNDLSILIAGDSNIDIDMFLAGVNFVYADDKLETIQTIIRGIAIDPNFKNSSKLNLIPKKIIPSFRIYCCVKSRPTIIPGLGVKAFPIKIPRSIAINTVEYH